MLKRFVILVLVLFEVQAVKASISDTIIAIDQVVAKGTKFENYSVGAKVISIDTFDLATNQMNSIAELLSRQSLVNVSIYSPGGLSAIKMRGGGSDHTTVIWNGLNLKPPMSGSLNASTLNSGVFNQIVIQPGGSSTMYGSGAATGIVILGTKLSLNKKGSSFGVSSELGSFGSYGVNTEGSYIGNNFGTRLFVAYQESENNFPYKYGSQTKTLEHGAYSNISVLQQNAFLFGANTKLETDIWYSNLFKQVAAEKADADTGKTEDNTEKLNLAINLAHYRTNWYLKYRGGAILYNNDYLGYDTNFYTVLNKSQSYINELEYKYSFTPSQKFFLGVNSTIDIAESESYIEKAVRNQLDFFGRYYFLMFNNKLKFNAEFRQANTDGEFLPIVYSGGIDYEFLPRLSINATGAKLYSLPDLNDLFWTETSFAYGNPHLEPEVGWSIGLGINHNYSNSFISINHELGLYYLELTDAITWLLDTTNKWTPKNVDGFRSQGLEFTGSVVLNFSKESVLSFHYDYAYTDAKLIDPDYTRGKKVQKPYEPKHSAGFRPQYRFRYFTVNSYLSYVGERLVDDVSLPLKRYFLLDLNFSYQLELGNSQINFYSKLKNIFNTDYEVMSGYAQPGIAIYLGINYKFL